MFYVFYVVLGTIFDQTMTYMYFDWTDELGV